MIHEIHTRACIIFLLDGADLGTTELCLLEHVINFHICERQEIKVSGQTCSLKTIV